MPVLSPASASFVPAFKHSPRATDSLAFVRLKDEPSSGRKRVHPAPGKTKKNPNTPPPPPPSDAHQQVAKHDLLPVPERTKGRRLLSQRVGRIYDTAAVEV